MNTTWTEFTRKLQSQLQDSGIDRLSTLTQGNIQTILRQASILKRNIVREEGRFVDPHEGIWEKRRRAARSGHNPRTGKALTIPERDAITFRPSAEFKREISGNGAPTTRANSTGKTKARSRAMAGKR